MLPNWFLKAFFLAFIPEAPTPMDLLRAPLDSVPIDSMLTSDESIY